MVIRDRPTNNSHFTLAGYERRFLDLIGRKPTPKEMGRVTNNPYCYHIGGKGFIAQVGKDTGEHYHICPDCNFLEHHTWTRLKKSVPYKMGVYLLKHNFVCSLCGVYK